MNIFDKDKYLKANCYSFIKIFIKKGLFSISSPSTLRITNLIVIVPNQIIFNKFRRIKIIHFNLLKIYQLLISRIKFCKICKLKVEVFKIYRNLIKVIYQMLMNCKVLIWLIKVENMLRKRLDFLMIK
jgi:hypothetical protein